MDHPVDELVLLVVLMVQVAASLPLLRYEGTSEDDRLLHLLPQHHVPRAGGGGRERRLRLLRRGALLARHPGRRRRRRDCGMMGRFCVQLLRSLLRLMLLLLWKLL